MAGTLLFVHGTGVRSRGYNDTLDLIRKGVAKANLALNVVGVDWGDTNGVDVTDPQLAAVLPLGTRALADIPTSDEVTAALWAQLLADPLFELRAATTRTPAVGGSIPLPNAAPPGVLAVDRVLWLAANVADPLPGGVTAAQIADAARWLSTQKVLSDAALAINEPGGSVISDAIARAVVARALSQARGELAVGPSALFVASERDALVLQLSTLIAQGQRGPLGWLWGQLVGFAEGQATSYVKSHRTGIMGAASPGIGDILLYERRGSVIATQILDAIKAAPPPVFAVGHSLGGIMLVDILSRQTHPVVRKLATAGSQSPMLLQFDALENLRKNSASAPFMPWLNFFDRNDFLSFCAKRAFANAPGIEDVEVVSGVPFPDSHGAYWHNQKVYDEMKRFWDAP